MDNDVNELGATLTGTGSHPSDQAAAHLGSSSVDPSRKLVVNKCHGGFGLSETAVLAYAARKGLTLYPEPSQFGSIMEPTWWMVPIERRPPSQDGWHEMTMDQRRDSNAAHDAAQLTPREIPRDDADLIAVVEALGEAASGKFAALKVVEIPADVEWTIEEYDGREWVAEKHRTW